MLINQAAFTGSAPPIVALALIVLGVLLIGASIRLFQIRVAALIAKRTFVRSSLKGTRSCSTTRRGPMEFVDREVANKFFDVMTFQAGFSVLASEGLGVVILSIVGIVVVAIYHPIFFAFSMLVTLLCLIIILGFAKRGVMRSYDRSSKKYEVAYWLSQVARTARFSARPRPIASSRSAPTTSPSAMSAAT